MELDKDRQAILTIAFELHKFPHEVENLPCSELDDLIMMRHLQHKEEEKARKKANKGRR